MRKDILELISDESEYYMEDVEKYLYEKWCEGHLSDCLESLKSDIGYKHFFSCVPLDFLLICNKDYVLEILKSNYYFKHLAKFIIDNKDEIL